MNIEATKNAFSTYTKLGQYEYPNRQMLSSNFIHTIVWDKTEEFKFIYKGQLSQDSFIFNGICMIVYNNGSIFEGYFKDDYKEGPGRYISPNGDYFIGEWKKGMKSGKGQLYSANGDFFIGEFDNDKMHGEGSMYYKDKISANQEIKVNYDHGIKITNRSCGCSIF